MRFAFPGSDEVDDGMVSDGQEIGDQATVAALPERFRAHEAGSGFCKRRLKRVLPIAPADARRVASERSDPDAAEPLFAGFTTPPAAELDRMPVADAFCGQRGRERHAVELWIAPRARIPTHIDERLRARLPQGLDQLVGGTGSVADGQDAHGKPIEESGRILLAMPLALSAALIFVSLTAAGCGSDSDEAARTSGSGTGQTIEIGETEFALDPSSVQVDQTGTVAFRVTNNGAIDHALEVDGQGIEEETDTIQPGKSAELTVDLMREGSYELYCPIGDHREQGMEGELIVGSASGGGGTGTMEDEDEDDGTTTSGDETGGYGY
jgi:uncharacterized cupredoxin-like copper-binding protein